MAKIHDSMKRLYGIAITVCGDATPSSVAKRLNVSPQVVFNWERRGISLSGSIEAERAYGSSPLWILEGIKPKA